MNNVPPFGMSAFDDSPDLQTICDKHNIGRHHLIIVAARLSRVINKSPKQTLAIIEQVDNLEEYILKAQLEKEQDIDDY